MEHDDCWFDMTFTFDRSKHVFYSLEFEELVKDTIRFFNGTPIQPLPPIEAFEGAGVYALYYIGKEEFTSNFMRLTVWNTSNLYMWAKRYREVGDRAGSVRALR